MRYKKNLWLSILIFFVLFATVNKQILVFLPKSQGGGGVATTIKTPKTRGLKSSIRVLTSHTSSHSLHIVVDFSGERKLIPSLSLSLSLLSLNLHIVMDFSRLFFSTLIVDGNGLSLSYHWIFTLWWTFLNCFFLPLLSMVMVLWPAKIFRSRLENSDLWV